MREYNNLRAKNFVLWARAFTLYLSDVQIAFAGISVKKSRARQTENTIIEGNTKVLRMDDEENWLIFL